MTTNYTVEEKDTVAGRLNSFSNYNNPALRQTASLAKRIGASRGLGLSSITAGDAAGRVFTQAADIAKVDSTNIINSNVQSSVNNTSMRNVDSQNASGERIATQQSDTSKYNTLLTTDTQKQIQAAEATSAAQRLAAQIESQEREGAAGRLSDSTNLTASLTSQEKVAAASEANRLQISTDTITANRENLQTELSAQDASEIRRLAQDMVNQDLNRGVERDGFASQERMTQTNLLAAERRAELDRDMQVTMQKLDEASNFRVEEMRAKYQVDLYQRESTSLAWGQFQQGLSNIDPNATPTSQKEAFTRQADGFDARMAYLEVARLETITARASGTNGVSQVEAHEAYRLAQSQGLSSDQVDRMAGLPVGTSAAWIAQNNLKAL